MQKYCKKKTKKNQPTVKEGPCRSVWYKALSVHTHGGRLIGTIFKFSLGKKKVLLNMLYMSVNDREMTQMKSKWRKTNWSSTVLLPSASWCYMRRSAVSTHSASEGVARFHRFQWAWRRWGWSRDRRTGHVEQGNLAVNRLTPEIK